MNIKVKNILYQLPAIQWAILILLLSIGDANSTFDWDILGIKSDKFYHLIFYFILMYLAILGYSKAIEPGGVSIRGMILLFVICIVWGVMIEQLQLSMNNGRQFELGDILVNAIGCLLCLLLIIIRLILGKKIAII